MRVPALDEHYFFPFKVSMAIGHTARGHSVRNPTQNPIHYHFPFHFRFVFVNNNINHCSFLRYYVSCASAFWIKYASWTPADLQPFCLRASPVNIATAAVMCCPPFSHMLPCRRDASLAPERGAPRRNRNKNVIFVFIYYLSVLQPKYTDIRYDCLFHITKTQTVRVVRVPIFTAARLRVVWRYMSSRCTRFYVRLPVGVCYRTRSEMTELSLFRKVYCASYVKHYNMHLCDCNLDHT